ncbi:MAG TPA: hypothetical protein VFM37_12165 [Pseudonocardiaceae bacterium]|nr:hypothetical protein [Pseudonocardiaceae bacterium]
MPVTAVLALVLCAGCTVIPGTPGTGSGSAVRPKVPSAQTTVLEGDDAASLAIAASQVLYDAAAVVVLAADGDLAGQARAASLAVALKVPMLLAAAGGDSSAVHAELRRLRSTIVVTVGGVATGAAADAGTAVVSAPADAAALSRLVGRQLEPSRPVEEGRMVVEVAQLDRDGSALLHVGPATPAEESAATTALPALAVAAALESVLVLVEPTPAHVAATATARASGAAVEVVTHPGPSAAANVVATQAQPRREHVVAVGANFGTLQTLEQRLQAAASGTQLPGGGRLLFPGRRMVALYGRPGSAALGALGEQPLDAAIHRAQELAASYQPHSAEPVVPAFEIIATVASAVPGADGNYSSEGDAADLRPWIDAAGRAGVYVVLDLQPGRTDFLTQAKLYEELLAEPHVGLALDPEWRLAANQRHNDQIGSVTAAEVNAVIAWLAELTRARELPQKLLMLHQFQLGMIRQRQQIDTNREELAVLIHADGFGTANDKFATWDSLHANVPPNAWWGWKNFYDEDKPTFTPEQTMAIKPAAPQFVSYQ